MFFRNLFLYRMHPDTAEDLKRITFELESHALRDVGPMEMGTFGSVAPLGASIEDAFTHTVGDCILFARGQNEKLLPAAVVNDEVQRKVQQIAEEEGRKVGGRERRRIKEDTLSLLLPRAFVRHSRTRAYADVKHGWIVIDTPTAKHAEHVVTLVREALGSFPVVPLAPEEAPRVLMTDWLASGNLPDGFALGDECLLRDPATSSGAIAKCSRQELDSEEVKEHLRNGKQVFQLGLVYDERMSFVLGEDLVVRKLRFLDLVTDKLGDSHEDTLSLYDAQFALMTLELQRLLSAFEEIFGLKVDAPLHLHRQEPPAGLRDAVTRLNELAEQDGGAELLDNQGKVLATFGKRNNKAPGNVRRRKASPAPS